MRVADAHGQAPSIPFWLGEAPGRSNELSAAVARLREEIAPQLDQGGVRALRWLIDRVGVDEESGAQLIEYLTAGRAALTALPTFNTIILERFFDESGGMQLVIHSPFGSRVNRAWGLALRKRFCRTFNFELQAAATEDHIVLSLSQAHSFELQDVAVIFTPTRCAKFWCRHCARRPCSKCVGVGLQASRSLYRAFAVAKKYRRKLRE